MASRAVADGSHFGGEMRLIRMNLSGAKFPGHSFIHNSLCSLFVNILTTSLIKQQSQCRYLN